MWASTDPDNKVTAAADGSYRLNVVKHSGTFTVIAEYTAGDGNYKTSDPRDRQYNRARPYAGYRAEVWIYHHVYRSRQPFSRLAESPIF